jgi:predicted DNA-binding antitoxin AbrB/MazE fold protein
MSKNPKTKKRGRVKRLIKSPDPSVPEKAEVEIHGADELYKEIRIDNKLEDEHGKKVKLKEGAEVDVVIEAEPKATTPDTSEKKH